VHGTLQPSASHYCHVPRTEILTPKPVDAPNDGVAPKAGCDAPNAGWRAGMQNNAVVRQAEADVQRAVALVRRKSCKLYWG
jgi:hypothetical protein